MASRFLEMKVGSHASSIAVCRPLPSGCVQSSHGRVCTHIAAHDSNQGASLRTLQLSSVQSLQSRVGLVETLKSCGIRHERARGRVCAQLAESKQVVEEQPKAASSKCILVVGATGGVGELSTKLYFSNYASVSFVGKECLDRYRRDTCISPRWASKLRL